MRAKVMSKAMVMAARQAQWPWVQGMDTKRDHGHQHDHEQGCGGE